MLLRSKSISLLGLLTFGVLFASCASQPQPDSQMTPAPLPNGTSHPEIRAAMAKIVPFFKPMAEPQDYDWLAAHHEPGQTFNEYLESGPTIPTKERRTIYVLPLGSFSRAQARVIEITAGFLEAFYGLPVKRLPQRAFTATYPNVRFNDLMHTRQIKTGHILNDVLPPLLPPDGAALIAFTTDDLYPDPSMNYVFGQASLDKRVGAWSLYRLSDRATSDKFIHRVIKIAAHETGHMFSMRHCTKYECVMSGTNHLGETDRRPIDACPECMAKVCWLSQVEPKTRYERLAKFCRTNKLVTDAQDFEKKARALSN